MLEGLLFVGCGSLISNLCNSECNKMNKNTIIHELFKKIRINIHQQENILHKNEKSSRHLSKKWYDTKGKLFF